MAHLYYYKTTICGKNEIEETYVKDGQGRGFLTHKHNIVKKKRCSEAMTDEDRARSLRRTLKNVRLLVKSNMTSKALFVTLTYKENEKNYKNTSEHFRRFIQHLKRRGYVYPYIATREHQRKRGQKNKDEGTIHFHIVFFGCSFLPYEKVLSYWQERYGNVDFNSIRSTSSTRDILLYVTKYIRKDIKENPQNVRRYLYNRSCIRPETIYTQIELDKPYYKVYYENTMLSDIDGKLYRNRFYKKI